MNTVLKKFSIFANLLMEKPYNSFAIVKLWKTHLKKTSGKGSASLLKNSVFGQLSVPVSAN